MDTTPLVSVLITLYNREQYISQAIESVLNSSYLNFELIIVDDQSKDKSVEIVKAYMQKDDRVKLHINEQNLGDYPNRNRAASYAKGRYIKYLDADDIIYKYSLEIMVDIMEQYPLAALGISYNMIDDLFPYPQLINIKETFYLEFLQKSILSYGPSATIIRREPFEKIGGFSGKQFIGDQELWLKLASKYPVVKIQPALVWYRSHEEQQIRLENKNIEVINQRYQLLRKTLHENKDLFDEENFKRANKRLIQHYARSLLRRLFILREIRNFILLYRLSDITFCGLLSGFKKYA